MLAVEALKLHATAAKTRTPKETRSPPLAVRILTPFVCKSGLREKLNLTLPLSLCARGGATYYHFAAARRNRTARAGVNVSRRRKSSSAAPFQTAEHVGHSSRGRGVEL